MHINKTSDMTPFNMDEKPRRQNMLLLPVIWAAAFIMTGGRLKVNNAGIKGLKPPYLVLSEHQGFTDYYISPLALFPHRATYVSDVEGFAAFGKWLYRAIGCIATRRFVGDISLINNIRNVALNNKDIIVIYPEARHSNVGASSAIPESTAKLVKLLGIPVVIQKFHGSYLNCPFWDEEHIRNAPLAVTLKKILSPEELEKLSAAEIHTVLGEALSYDEYARQFKNKIRISYKNRAKGLHRVLYRCPSCGTEYKMTSFENVVECIACGKQWMMDEYGRLSAAGGNTEFPHIPDWYEFQRGEVRRQIESGEYNLTAGVRIDALPNEKGFVPLGDGILHQDFSGFELTFGNSGRSLHFSSKVMHSVHTEYSYKGQGDCVVLSTRDCCYYVYPKHPDFNITKVQFAAEEFHRIAKKC